jgi:RNA polymerase sigma-70 factor (ECF subfamily)
MNQAELEQLYARLEKPIYNVVYRWVWQAEEAQDVVQEAFVRLWRMRDRVDPATVEPLVYKIALNLAASRVRWRKIRRWVSLESLREAPARAPDAEARFSRREQRARVRAAVERLPEQLRQVILLCEYSELSYEEIAGILSVPSGTVGSRRHRALKLLREQLTEATTTDERTVRQTL